MNITIYFSDSSQFTMERITNPAMRSMLRFVNDGAEIVKIKTNPIEGSSINIKKNTPMWLFFEYALTRRM